MRYFMLAAMMLLTACGGAMTTSDAGIKEGKFHVAAVEVAAVYGFPGENYRALEQFKPYLQQAMQDKLHYLNNTDAPRALVMQVEVTQLDTKLSGVKALMVGDNQSITSTIYLKDPQTGEVLARSKPITTIAADRAGLVGMLANYMSTDDMTLTNMANEHATSLIDTIY